VYSTDITREQERKNKSARYNNREGRVGTFWGKEESNKKALNERCVKKHSFVPKPSSSCHTVRKRGSMTIALRKYPAYLKGESSQVTNGIRELVGFRECDARRGEKVGELFPKGQDEEKDYEREKGKASDLTASGARSKVGRFHERVLQEERKLRIYLIWCLKVPSLESKKWSYLKPGKARSRSPRGDAGLRRSEWTQQWTRKARPDIIKKGLT